MIARWIFAAALLGAALACACEGPSRGHSRPKGDPMTEEFEAARAAFIQYASQTLQVDPGDLKQVSGGPAAYRRMGRFWQMGTYAQGPQFVGAWVAADGTLITSSQNLALLVSIAPPEPEPLAKDLAWLIKPNLQLWIRPREGARAPAWAALPGGGRALTFVTNWREPGPHMSPERFTRYTLTLASDGAATFQEEPWTPSPP
jgi:hypothetical protein